MSLQFNNRIECRIISIYIKGIHKEQLKSFYTKHFLNEIINMKRTYLYKREFLERCSMGFSLNI